MGQHKQLFEGTTIARIAFFSRPYIWFDDAVFKNYARIVDKADAIVAVSSSVQKYFCSRGAIDPRSVQVIPNGIDAEDLDITDLPDSLTRKGLQIAEGMITLCIPASILPAKHQIGMIGVMEELRKTNPNIVLLILGNVGDENYDKKLRLEVEKSPAASSIHMLPYFDHRYMGEFLRKTTDVFLLPTLYEGCSNAVLEAAYCGKPMILTDVGNARDMIGHAQVKIVPCAYPDIDSVRLADIEKIAYEKQASNMQAIAQAIREYAEHLESYEAKAKSYLGERQNRTMGRMIESYCKLIESL